ncbi:flagellin [Jatrophihabitans cynanchi]|uniref:Flagellin n=1 Tax=Jatrophihabitans cynanchi TaxID=2944128 RepID=A0ABY7JSB4_9ACTN|nr:flagellin [Jatrophihabitans sp. SB3-54]WAX55451.1 flagellin [Jatrophihabitans sp. SB3-54]
MSLRINTNVAALNAYNNLAANQNAQASSFERLSSGLRINKAADDAAGLSISQGLTSQINGLTQAVSNAQDGINVAQIADGALGTTQNILQRMRTLVVQAGNEGTQDDSSLKAIQGEISKLNSQLDNIAGQTKFGATNLLDGNFSKNFQVGANGGDTIGLDLSGAGVQAWVLGNSSTALTAPAAGAPDPKSTNTDGTATLSGLNIVKYDGTTGYTDNEGTAALKTYGTTQATDDLATIDAAISTISEARSGIGATQNQLNYTVTNLQTAITNVTASRSNLTDADLASEVTKMTQSQILTQAATSVLAQANSAPQAILKLLQ